MNKNEMDLSKLQAKIDSLELKLEAAEDKLSKDLNLIDDTIDSIRKHFLNVKSLNDDIKEIIEKYLSLEG